MQVVFSLSLAMSQAWELLIKESKRESQAENFHAQCRYSIVAILFKVCFVSHPLKPFTLALVIKAPVFHTS